MSDSCDITRPVTHESEMDRGLTVYRDSHRAVARYTLILKENFTANAPFKTIKKGLDYVSADNECESLNAARAETGFGAPVYAIERENSEAARLAVSVAAERYWAARRAESKLPLAA